MKSVLVASAAAVTLSGCALKGDVRRVEREVQALRAETARADSVRAVELGRIISLLDGVQDSLSVQQRRLVLLQGEVRADITEVTRQLVQIQELTGQSQQRLTELRRQLEDRMSQPPPPVAAAPGDTTAAPPAGPAPAAGEPGPDQLYDVALQQLRRGSPQTARLAFRRFLTLYPDHPRTADALFFLGESWAGTDPDSAAVAYERVAQDHRDSPRAPAALYKLGLLAEQAGDTARARLFYQRVLAGYPRSEEAALAREKLQTLGR